MQLDCRRVAAAVRRRGKSRGGLDGGDLHMLLEGCRQTLHLLLEGCVVRAQLTHSRLELRQLLLHAATRIRL